jgi:hypothetical protein
MWRRQKQTPNHIRRLARRRHDPLVSETEQPENSESMKHFSQLSDESQEAIVNAFLDGDPGCDVTPEMKAEIAEWACDNPDAATEPDFTLDELEWQETYPELCSEEVHIANLLLTSTSAEYDAD